MNKKKKKTKKKKRKLNQWSKIHQMNKKKTEKKTNYTPLSRDY